MRRHIFFDESLSNNSHTRKRAKNVETRNKKRRAYLSNVHTYISTYQPTYQPTYLPSGQREMRELLSALLIWPHLSRRLHSRDALAEEKRFSRPSGGKFSSLSAFSLLNPSLCIPLRGESANSNRTLSGTSSSASFT